MKMKRFSSSSIPCAHTHVHVAQEKAHVRKYQNGRHHTHIHKARLEEDSQHNQKDPLGTQREGQGGRQGV